MGSGLSDGDATRRVAEFVATHPSDEIPEQAVWVARRCILDCVGVMLAGTAEASSRIVMSYVEELGGSGTSTVVGTDVRASPQDAALANGVLAHSMDFDDSHSGACGHPSVAIVPSILAVGELVGASGRDALDSYVVAFELVHRIGACIGRSMFDHGFHATAAWGPLGAAAAASRLMRLTAEQTVMALGIAASQAGGLFLNFGTMTKPLHAGHAARAGVMSAMLARRDFTAHRATFDDPENGYLRAYGGRSVDHDEFLGDLGHQFAIEERMQFKLHPSCARTHPGIRAALWLVREHDLRPDQVTAIRIITSEKTPPMLPYSRPTTALEAKWSLEYCIAAALLDREVGPRQFTDAAVLRPEARRIVERTTYEHPPERQRTDWEAFLESDLIVMETVDGRKLEHCVELPPGMLMPTVSDEDLARKYRECAAVVLEPDAVTTSLDLLLRLDSVDKLSDVAAVVVGSSALR